MPRGTTTTVNSDDVSVASDPRSNLPAMEFDELMTGLPETQRNVRLDRIAGDDPAAPKPPGLREAPDGKVVLLNLKYENETFWVPEVDPNTGQPRFVGQTKLEFVDGYIICTEDQADFILERAPYVHREIKGDPVLTFPQTGFKTTIPAALTEYSVRWAGNQ